MKKLEKEKGFFEAKTHEKTGKKIDLNLFSGNENSYLKLINQNRKIDLVFNHKARYASDVNYEIFSKLGLLGSDK